MAKPKRERQRANRQSKRALSEPPTAFTDAELDRLLVEVAVRVDCEHASTRSTPDGVVLLRCARQAAVGGGCPSDCAEYEARRIGGLGTGT